MRIILDLQGAQSESNPCDIRQDGLDLAQGIARNRGQHEVLIALSGLLPNRIESLRAAFADSIPQQNIHIWQAPGPVRRNDPANEARRQSAELIREAFLLHLAPDIVHLDNPFPDLCDDGVISIGRFDDRTPVSVMLFEFNQLPALEHQRDRNPHFARRHDRRQRDDLQRASLFLAVSEYAARDGIEQLALSPARILTIDKINDDAQDVWDRAARQLIARWEELVQRSAPKGPPALLTRHKPKLAFVSPLPPERTGIADYSAELLPALAQHYDIEIVVDQDQVDLHGLETSYRCRDPNWLRTNARNIDRVLYHVGNSRYHHHMLDLVEEIPGTLVLHDFYVSHLLAWLELVAGAKDAWTQALFQAHGYSAVRERYTDIESAKQHYPCNFHFLQHAQGIITHSAYCQHLTGHWYANDLKQLWAVIPLLRSPAQPFDRNAARRKLRYHENDFIVCSFGFIGDTKLNHRLLDAWLQSDLAHDPRCQLIFVGQNHSGDYGNAFARQIRQSSTRDRIRITGYASADDFRTYLQSADLAVQLRAQSRGETSAAVHDVMNYGIPLIVNANGALAELDRVAVQLLPDRFEDSDLVDALQSLRRSQTLRARLSERARQVIQHQHSPAACARHYAEAIERFHHGSRKGTNGLIQAIADAAPQGQSDEALCDLAHSISLSLPERRPAKRLLLDVSGTANNDLKTGIERVAKALTLALIDAPPSGYRAEPVYLSDQGGRWHYRLASCFTLSLLGCPTTVLSDEVVEPDNGDILVGLDLSGDRLIAAEQSGLFRAYRARGVSVYFMVHDLLPVRMPEVFPPGADETHKRWLRAISTFDGAICTSQQVADELRAWQMEQGIDHHGRRPFHIGYSHHGADFNRRPANDGGCSFTPNPLKELGGKPCFLMVGTIEPRKGHLQAIEAFTQLWAKGHDITLVIVGREGWTDLPNGLRRTIPETLFRIRSHPEQNQRLFWHEDVGDEDLAQLYGASSCLLVASRGEGFGLPLIEAAHHHLPIIARDLPVFREIAGDSAYYFSGDGANDLAFAIQHWLSLRKAGTHPDSHSISHVTWRQSAARLSALLPIATPRPVLEAEQSDSR